MLDINGGELIILVVLAIIVVGPERMPEYARQLRNLVVRARDLARDSKASIKSEVGDDVDWSQLDPRQYDPRRIVRDALNEPPAPTRAAAVRALSEPGAAPTVPVDMEAT